MAEVIALDGDVSKRAGIPNADVIKFAEEMLTKAKSGHIQQLAMVWRDSTGFVGDGYVPMTEMQEMLPLIGGIELCKATLLSQMVNAE